MYPTRLVISGFLGIGKSRLTREGKYTIRDTSYEVIDLDSHMYHYTESGNLNEDFIEDYSNAILSTYKEYVNDPCILLVSTHEPIREFLVQQKIPFWLVIPNDFDSVEFMKRYQARRDFQKQIDFIINNWDRMLQQLKNFAYENSEYCTLYQTHKYLIDILPTIFQVENKKEE